MDKNKETFYCIKTMLIALGVPYTIVQRIPDTMDKSEAEKLRTIWVSQIVHQAFKWEDTPEGVDFWLAVAESRFEDARAMISPPDKGQLELFD